MSTVFNESLKEFLKFGIIVEQEIIAPKIYYFLYILPTPRNITPADVKKKKEDGLLCRINSFGGWRARVGISFSQETPNRV